MAHVEAHHSFAPRVVWLLVLICAAYVRRVPVGASQVAEPRHGVRQGRAGQAPAAPAAPAARRPLCPPHLLSSNPCRPHKGEKLRPYWEFVHHWVGRAAAVVATANIYE